MKNIVNAFLIVVITMAMATAAWAKGGTRDDVVVFVIDSTSSILADDQRFLSQFNTFSHGGAVLRIIGSEASGIFNVDDLKGNMDKDKYYSALLFIQKQIKGLRKRKRVVVNMSLGSPLPTRREYLIIRQLYESGAIMIAAAGNDGMEECWYPAAYDEVISVGACEKSVIASYSNNCKDIDIVADGKYTEIRTRTSFLEQSTEKLTLHGTSFSAPRVTSIVVKMLKEKPGLSKDEIVDILQRTSIKIPYSKCKGGRLNGLKALAEVSDRYRGLYRFENWSLFTLATISTIVIAGFLAFSLFVFVLLPFSTFLFRLFMPEVWLYLKKKGIQKVMGKKEKSDKGIRLIVKCLIAQDCDLEEIAKKALLDICEISPSECRGVQENLRFIYRRAKVNDFINEKTPISSLLAEIDERFYRVLW